MNDFQAWNQIIDEWKKVDRLRRLNQELYDQLGDIFFYILKYTEKNNIPIPNRQNLFGMMEKLHERIDFIYPPDGSYRTNDEKDDRHDVNSTRNSKAYIFV